nr:hypothetical protein [Mycoplasmopsis bovis]
MIKQIAGEINNYEKIFFCTFTNFNIPGNRLLACDNKDKATPKILIIKINLLSEIQKLKDELQYEITKATSKRNHYLGDYTDYAFNQSAKVIQEAVYVHHNAKTVEEVKKAIEKLKAGIKEIDAYFALSKEEKQKLAMKRF